jgi:hypothetical protein
MIGGAAVASGAIAIGAGGPQRLFVELGAQSSVIASASASAAKALKMCLAAPASIARAANMYFAAMLGGNASAMAAAKLSMCLAAMLGANASALNALGKALMAPIEAAANKGKRIGAARAAGISPKASGARWVGAGLLACFRLLPVSKIAAGVILGAENNAHCGLITKHGKRYVGDLARRVLAPLRRQPYKP